MNLQPLYDVKERLEYAAIAGTGLLGEDFRLQRAVEHLKPLAGASPVFAKIDSGLQKLLTAPAQERSGRLLDVLALVDAVAYTQAGTGGAGELEPLPSGAYTYRQISYNQMNPLLTALTTTGGGRMEVIQNAWENHPEFFLDYRVLPAVAAGLGDGYGEIADLNGEILKKLGPAVIPLLKSGFDPAGNREMARRVEVISEVEREQATPWLREILPNAKKDVRAAVITALGGDSRNVGLLLDLTKSERGKNREAALEVLAFQDGAEVRAFWEKELEKNSQSVKFLQSSNTDWAIDLVSAGLRQRLEALLDGEKRPAKEEFQDAASWCQAIGQKESPVMLEFWRWADGHMESIDRLNNEKDNPLFLGVRLTDHMRDIMQHTGPGPLRDFCLTLFERRPEMTRYLHISFQAALLSRPAAEVYEQYGSYLLTKQPLLDKERKETLNNVLLRALEEVSWNREQNCHILNGGQRTAEPLDPRWIDRLVHTACKPSTGRYYPFGVEEVNGFDKILMELVNPAQPEQCAKVIPYLRQRMTETGSWYSFGHYLLEVGGSPKGVLGEAMKKGKPAYLYHVWQLLDEAAKVLPAGEVSELCQEVLDAKWLRRSGVDLELAKQVLPWTMEQLRAGKPFPAWDEWWSMRK